MVSKVGWLAVYIPLKPPEVFNFRKPDEWSKWIKRFEFRLASGISGRVIPDKLAPCYIVWEKRLRMFYDLLT